MNSLELKWFAAAKKISWDTSREVFSRHFSGNFLDAFLEFKSAERVQQMIYVNLICQENIAFEEE